MMTNIQSGEDVLEIKVEDGIEINPRSFGGDHILNQKEREGHGFEGGKKYEANVQGSFLLVKEEALSDEEGTYINLEERTLFQADEEIRNRKLVGICGIASSQGCGEEESRNEILQDANGIVVVKQETEFGQTSFVTREMIQKDSEYERRFSFTSDYDDGFEEVDQFYEEEFIEEEGDDEVEEDVEEDDEEDFSDRNDATWKCDAMERESDDDYGEEDKEESSVKCQSKSLFACNLCPKAFQTQKGYKRHKLGHSKKRKNSCSNCFQNFRFKKDLLNHTCKKLSTVCTICGKKLNDLDALLRHGRVHTGEKPYECQICNKRFLEKGNLAIHYRIHTNERPYKCPHCDKTFSDQSNFNRHRKSHLSVEISKAYTCRICNQRFTRSSSLYRHYVRLHRGEPEILGDDFVLGEGNNYVEAYKKESCRFCDKKFGTQEGLRRHELLHQECDMFRCQLCQKMFSSKDNLNAHSRVHNNDLSCNYCEVSFNRRDSLVRHERMHENARPFACTDCDARFTMKRSLTRHKQTHSGVKPHGCDACGKRFYRSSDLTVHRRTHSHEKPYTCDKCEKGFAAQTNFVKHVRFCEGKKKKKAKRERKAVKKSAASKEGSL